MFLHPVNVRCLVREYGSLEQSPEKISATVVEIAGYSMSEVRLWRTACDVNVISGVGLTAGRLQGF